MPCRKQQRRKTTDLGLFGVGPVAPTELAVSKLGLQPSTDNVPGGTGPGVDGGPRLKQCSDDRGVPLRHRPHQCGLVLQPLPSVHICTARNKRPDDRRTPGARTGHQNRLAGRHRGVGVSTGGKQYIHHRRACVRTCQRQRRNTVVIGRTSRRASLKELLDELQVVVIRRPEQYSRTVSLDEVHVGLASQEVANHFRIPRLDRLQETEPVALRQRGSGRRHNQSGCGKDPPTP